MVSKFTSTIDLYNKHAAQFVQHFERKLDTTELDKFLKLLSEGSRIVDAGCGSARDAAYMISRGYEAIGIDLSEGLLAEAHKLHPEVPTQLMSLTEISFGDELFAGVWCKAVLLHIDRAEAPRVLEQFHRILKPNGILFIQTKAGDGEGTQPVPFDPKLKRYFTFFTHNQLRILFEAAGFSVIESYYFNGKSRAMGSRDQEWVVAFGRK